MEVILKMRENGKGAFVLVENGKQLGEMEVGIHGDTLIVYHTEIDPGMEGHGLSKRLLEAMTEHAREHHMMVMPLCSFVQGQFNKHDPDYQDIWKKHLS